MPQRQMKIHRNTQKKIKKSEILKLVKLKKSMSMNLSKDCTESRGNAPNAERYLECRQRRLPLILEIKYNQESRHYQWRHSTKIKFMISYTI